LLRDERRSPRPSHAGKPVKEKNTAKVKSVIWSILHEDPAFESQSPSKRCVRLRFQLHFHFDSKANSNSDSDSHSVSDSQLPATTPQLEIPTGQCNANKLAFDLNLNGNRAPRPKAMQKIHLAYKPTHSGLNIAIGNFELTQVN